jgi:hypothetical protein
MPWSPAFAVQRGNRIHQRQGFLRVVPVRAGQAHRERHARPWHIRWRLLPRFARSVGFGPVWSPPHTARTEQLSTTARDQSIWSSRASQSSSAKWIRSHTPASCQSRKRRQHVIPDRAPEFRREHLPGNAAPKDEDNACEARAIRDARPPTLWPPRWNRQERFDKNPQRIWKQRGSHARSRYLAEEDQFLRFCYTLLGIDRRFA